MTHDDLLHDLLVDAAGAPPVDPASAVRGRAQRRQARRRAVTAGTLAVAAVAVAVTVATGVVGSDRAEIAPAPPGPTEIASPPPTTPSLTPQPSQTSSAPSSAPATTPVTQADLADLRFADEERWASDPDFPSEVTEGPYPWLTYSCALDDQSPPPTALAMRSVAVPGPETGLARQIAVFEGPAAASAAFTDLRAAIRTCQAANSGPQTLDPGLVVTRDFVGGQLELGTESFWTASRDVVTSGNDSQTAGSELFYSNADVYVLDENVVTVFTEGSFTDHARAETVAAFSAEWEALRPRYAAVLR